MKLLLPVIAFLAIIISSFQTFAQTNVSGILSANTAWTKAGSPYILTGNVGIPGLYKLTIEPGVTVRRDGDYQILAQGAVVANGSATDSIIFESGPALGQKVDPRSGYRSADKYFIQFQRSYLPNSSLQYVSFKNGAFTNLIREGDSEVGIGDNANANKGTLTISRSSLNNGATQVQGGTSITPDGYNGGGIILDNCVMVWSSLLLYATKGDQPCTIRNSQFHGAYISASGYGDAKSLENCYVNKSTVGMGDNGFSAIKVKFEESSVGGGRKASVANSIFLNSALISLGILDIERSKFVTTKATKQLILAGSITIKASELINTSGTDVTGIVCQQFYPEDGSNKINDNIFVNTYDGLMLWPLRDLAMHGNSFINTARYFVNNTSDKYIDATGNYFITKPGKGIDDMIIDAKDDIRYGPVLYDPVASAPSATGPLVPPVNVYKEYTANGILVKWDKSTQAGIKNYKVYWGDAGVARYRSSAMVAATDNSFLIPSASLNDSIAVTALNNNATGTDDMMNGNESWYAPAYQKAATFTSFGPLTATRGDVVTITGTDLNNVTAVKFGNVAARSFTIVSPTTITAIVELGASGKVSLTSGTKTIELAGFTYTIPLPVISSFSPTSARNGTFVIIKGDNFTNASAVSFGGTPALYFTVNSATEISAMVGQGNSGDIAVTTPGGTGKASGFTYLPAPTITSVTPTVVKAGGIVTITGINFTGATKVSFGGVDAASYTVVSPTTITATVSNGATGAVSVANANGSASFNGFVYVPMPVISGPSLVEVGLGGTTNLFCSTVPSVAYQWYRNGIIIPAATFSSYAAGITGSYTVSMSSGNITQTSAPVDLRVAVFPTTFRVNAVSATCKGSNTGSISIRATSPVVLTATISGPSTNITQNFTIDLNVPNLPAGTYNVCIDYAPQAFQRCFTVVVSEPKDLALYSTINKTTNSVDLVLTGANNYTVQLNGVKHITNTGLITLSLNKGNNDLVVSSDIACQGILQKRIRISDDITAYPNPFTTSLALDLGTKVIEQAKVQIFNSFGKLVYTQQFNGKAGLVNLDLSNLQPTQVYVLQLSADGNDFINKIIKK